MKKYLAIYFFLLYFSFCLLSCETNDPPPVEEKKKITLSVDEVTTTEAWLKLVTQNIELPKELTLLRDGDTTETFILSVNDTVIYQSFLLPSNSYTYQASSIEDQVTSNELTVETMDTTSHDYNWEEITLGEFQSSLYDVWGTDENNVYAVGGVIIDGESYGVLHYDGTTWNKIQGVGGYAVYGFGENDIWVVGARVFNYNGVEWKRIDGKTVDTHSEPLDTVLFENGAYYSVWGTSSSDLYLGSTWGKIIHWDGSKGEVMDVQGSSTFYDIWGLNQNEVYAVAGAFGPSNSELFKYNGSTWEIKAVGVPVATGSELQDPFFAVWGSNTKLIYFGGSLLYNLINKSIKTVGRIGKNIVYGLRGTATNNIFAVGSNKSITHYNGAEWYNYEEIKKDGESLNSVWVSERMVVAVGWDGVQAKIVMLRKNN